MENVIENKVLIKSSRSRAFIKFCLDNKLLCVSLLAIAFIMFMTIIGPFFMPYDPVELDYSQKLLAPSSTHIFGTDSTGRDIFTRVVFGAATSIGVTLSVVLITLILGLFFGVIAGLFGGIVDMIIMRIVEVMLAFPSLIFTLAVLGTIGPGTFNQIIAMSIVGWAGYARLARTETKSIMSSEFIDQAKTIGCSKFRIIIRYALPNIISNMLVMATLRLGPVLLSTSALSYLGLGAQIPSPEWGLMVSSGKDFIRDAPWITIFPGLATLFTSLAFNCFGESLQDLFDPKRKERTMND